MRSGRLDSEVSTLLSCSLPPSLPPPVPNNQVGQQVNDLYEDLRDGSRLMKLIELLTGEKLVRAGNT